MARRLGVDAAAAERGLAAAPRAEMRLDPVNVGGVEILNDAYNANPESMLAAIETFAELVKLDKPAGRAVVVLGALGLSMSDPLPFQPDCLDPGARVVDILMKPEGTPLLKACDDADLIIAALKPLTGKSLTSIPFWILVLTGAAVFATDRKSVV